MQTATAPTAQCCAQGVSTGRARRRASQLPNCDPGQPSADSQATATATPAMHRLCFLTPAHSHPEPGERWEMLTWGGHLPPRCQVYIAGTDAGDRVLGPAAAPCCQEGPPGIGAQQHEASSGPAAAQALNVRPRRRGSPRPSAQAWEQGAASRLNSQHFCRENSRHITKTNPTRSKSPPRTSLRPRLGCLLLSLLCASQWLATRVGKGQTRALFINKPRSFFIRDKNSKVPHTMPCPGDGMSCSRRPGPAAQASGGCSASGGLRGGGRSVAEGHGLHVKEADVHLGLDVDPLPDLKRTERREGLTLTQASPEPSPPPAGIRDVPVGQPAKPPQGLPLCAGELGSGIRSPTCHPGGD